MSSAELAGTSALVTDVERRKALPIIRELGRAGVRVIGASAHRVPMGGLSRYCERVLRYPDYHDHPSGFVEWIRETAERERIDVLFPIEDDSLSICVERRASWDHALKSLLPAPDSLRLAADKWETMQLARSIGLRTPRTYCPASKAAFEELAAGWTGPAVVKPRVSSGSRGLRFAGDARELEAAYTEVASRYPRPLIQERLPSGGAGVGVFVLLDASQEPLAVFGHRRLREYPITGGPSTLRESYYDAELVDRSVRLLRAMRLVGVAMVEYKTDMRTGEAVLMEVNPRFWGSLQLAVQAGVNFPVLFHRAALGMPFDPVLHFEAGVLCRWLWPGDVLHFLKNPDRFRLEPSFFKFRGMGYDILSRTDPWPALGIVLEGLRKVARRERR